MTTRNTENNQPKIETQVNQQGFYLSEDGLLSLKYPVEKFGVLPEYVLDLPEKNLFTKTDMSFIENLLLGKTSLETYQDYFIEIVSRIFSTATSEVNMSHFARFFILKHDDFVNFRSILKKIDKKISDFAGINLMGNIFMDSSNANQAFTIAFHELGHSFHKPDNFFNDELRAYFFQELCKEIMQDQIHKMGSNVQLIGISISEEEPEGKKAYLVARALTLNLMMGEQLNRRLQKYKKIIFLK